jgi:hypothetical protein
MTAYSAQMLEDLSVAIQRKMPGFENVGCVVVDEHSTIADMDLLAVTKVRAIRDSGSKDKDEDQPQQPDMYISTNRIRKFTAPLIALDTHLILVAHQRIDKDNMNVPTIAPSYMPKLNIHLRNMLSLVAHSEADEFLTEGGTIDYKRTAQVMPTRKVIAKTRLGGFSGPKVTYAEVNANAYNWLNGDVPTVNEDVIQPEETEPVTETEVNDFAIEIEEVTV